MKTGKTVPQCGQNASGKTGHVSGPRKAKELLEKQKAKLKDLEAEADRVWDDRPWAGHGGTPLVDNSTGRARAGQLGRYEGRLRRLMREVEEQKAKIERTQNRIDCEPVPTKKSKKFLAKHPIHPLLFELEKEGKLKQWASNPQYFFVVGAKKVALITRDGKIVVSNRFPVTTQEDKTKVLNVIGDHWKGRVE